jgi:uncharacterized LabA/DUF88 family protein
VSYDELVSDDRWMQFVDGENFTIRAQEIAAIKGALRDGPYNSPDVFVWYPYYSGTMPVFERRSPQRRQLNSYAIRGYYYTSVAGDDLKVQATEQALWKIGFTPRVFKKDNRREKTKGVDIALATDVLTNAFLNNYDIAVLIAGDGDYAPMVREVKRLGKEVYVAFFKNTGLSPRLKIESDQFFDVESTLHARWQNYSPGQEIP